MITAFFSVCSGRAALSTSFASFAQFAIRVLPNNAVLSCLVVSIPACWQVENLTKFKMISTKNSSSHNNDRLDCMLWRHVTITYTHLWPFETLLKVDSFYLFQTCKVDTVFTNISVPQMRNPGLRISRSEAKQDWLRCTIQELGFWEHPFRRARKVLLLKAVKIHQIKTYQIFESHTGLAIYRHETP